MKTTPSALILGALFLASSASGQITLVPPLAGVPYDDWSIVNYVDLNAGSGFIDYSGGGFTYNGHNAIDFTLANFAAMDAGVPVYAAANGTVSFVHDGEFDRCSNVEVCGDNPNWIRIEHASGVATEYLHLKRGSISVSPGQQVVAGQQIGLVGSSGLSSDPHLHFAVFQNGNVVETYLNPNAWWSNPLTYSGDVFGTLDHGITHNMPTFGEITARPNENDVFLQSDGAGQQAWMWARLHGVDAGDAMNFFFFRPNGTLYTTRSFIAPSNINYGWWSAGIDLPAVPDVGTWQVFMQLKGSTVGVEVFDVVPTAQTKTWIGGSGSWGSSFNWQFAAGPYAGDNIRITPSDGLSRTITYEPFPFTPKSFWLDLTGPGTNRVTFNTLGHDLKLVDGFIIGYNGRATFNQTGGSVTSANTNANAIVGYQSGSDGVYNMSGNSILSVADNLIVGTSNGSRGTFNQTGGTTSTGARLSIGDGVGANGTYSISGSNSTLNVAHEIFVGNAGTGFLSASGGATVYSRGTGGGHLGFLPGSSGTVTLDGAGTAWIIPDFPSTFGVVHVGLAGTGALAISNGALLANRESWVGQDSGSAGSVVVTGIGSRWNLTDQLTIGHAGIGSLTVGAGAQVSNVGAVVGASAGSLGTVIFDCPGSKWNNPGYLHIGSIGRGTVTVSGAALVHADGEILVNRFAAGNGTLVVTGSASTVVTGGELRIADEGIGQLRIENGGDVFSLRGYLARNAPSADATAVVTGAGSTWTISEWLYVGGAGVGRLTVANGGVVSAPSGVFVTTNGTLSGDGTIVGSVLVNGVVAPGTSPGKLHITGNYAHNSTGRLQIEIASPASFDGLDVLGYIGLDGSLEVSLIGGYVPVGTKSFDILDWTGGLSFTFDSIQLPTLGGMLTWNTSQLYTTGVLSVIGPPPPPGDFNEDSKVDAADYVWWRKNGGTQQQFNLWRANFGNMAGSGASVSTDGSTPANVPEPSLAIPMLSAASLLLVVSRRFARSEWRRSARWRASMNANSNNSVLIAARRATAFTGWPPEELPSAIRQL
jgi:T5SS/PEP-CTERM-associated repeat protein